MKIYLDVSQLTHYERRRLNMARQCPICAKSIMDDDYICMSKIKDRRNMWYTFYHADCFRSLAKEWGD